MKHYRRQHPWDGSIKAGTPTGPVLRGDLFIREDIHGNNDPAIRFADGSWEFEWNVTEVEVIWKTKNIGISFINQELHLD